MFLFGFFYNPHITKSQNSNKQIISQEILNKSRLLNNKGYDSLLEGNYLSAIKLFNEAIDLNPYDTKFFQNRAYAYSNIDSLKKARKNYIQAIELSPNNAEIYRLCGQIEYKLGNDSAAYDNFSKAIKLVYPGSFNKAYSNYFMNRGNVLLRQSKYEKAIKDYTKAIYLNPSFYGNYNNRAIAFYRIGEIQKACSDWNMSTIKDSLFTPAKEYFKKHCKDFNDNDNFLFYPYDIIDYNIKNVEFKGGTSAMIGFLTNNIKHPEVARKNNTQGIVLTSFIVEKDGSISNINVEKGIGDGCDKEAKRIIKESSGLWNAAEIDGKLIRMKFYLPVYFILGENFFIYAKSSINKGVQYYEKEEWGKAIHSFSKVINKNYNLKDAYFYRANCHIQMENYYEAVRDFESAKNIGKIIESKQISDAYFNLGLKYYTSELYDSAIHYYSNAIQSNILNYNAYHNRGISYYKIGSMESACIDWAEASNLGMAESKKLYQTHCNNEKLSIFYFRKATHLSVQNKYRQAIKYYTKTIDMFPEMPIPYMKRGICFKEISDLKSACIDWKKAAKLGNKKAKVLYSNSCE